MDGVGGSNGESKRVADPATVAIAAGRVIDTTIKLSTMMSIGNLNQQKRAAQDAADAMRNLERLIDHMV